MIQPSCCTNLEGKFRATQDYRPFPCSQFIRHNQVSFTRAQLDQWKTPYHVVDQPAGQFVITHPQGYHQVSSPASSMVEAVTFGAKDWDYEGYDPCQGGPCPEDVCPQSPRCDFSGMQMWLAERRPKACHYILPRLSAQPPQTLRGSRDQSVRTDDVNGERTTGSSQMGHE